MPNDEILAHHGILGQKWGIRRYQNVDGSLTPAGRRRASKLKSEYRELTKKNLKGKIPKESPEGKPVKQLTDTELSDRIRRLQNEKTAINLEKDLSSNGKKFVRSLGRDVLAPAAIDAGRNTATKLFSKWMNKALKLDTSGLRDEFEELKRSTTVAKLKKEKYQAERDLKEMMAKEKAKNEEKARQKESKPEEVKAEYVGRASYKETVNSGRKYYKDVQEANFTDTSVNSTALTVYRNNGKDWFDRLYKN